ncbi:cellobiose dehydrogenase [Glonium stellatum]|uniref:Cellobiose dehydrogenase n=1 Tax=Glonium stellatum TaxID=574774 RepID=A0A8E2JMG8_9PEZI|nr:cellobiose dehydrogenase [Glonium stellatum]
MKLSRLFIVASISSIRFAHNVLASPPSNSTWDYIIVGAGAAGIPLADGLSESGKSVLLLERGFASSHRWGGQLRPSWLDGSNLTRFDVPGLYGYIWTNNTENSGILCSDYEATAGCVLGGGTAVNAGLWWKPPHDDWDLVFPPGWHSADMAPYVEKAFRRIPWTDTPSTDGKRYFQNAATKVTNVLTTAGYTALSANDHPNAKSSVVSNSEYLFLHGERGGIMATYLVSAAERKNFQLQMNTTVARLVRKGDTVTGVEVEASGVGGYSGTIAVTPNTGRVILSAGVFGTAKILFRSGIGPKDQLEIVKASPEGPNMIDEKDWIDLPVGYNLDDNPNAFLVALDPTIEAYDYIGAYNTPIAADAAEYLANRSGPLAQVEGPINPIFWDTVTGGDNITREVQWSVNSGALSNTTAIAFTASLGRGKTARGRLTITPNLTINVSTLPYFNDPGAHDATAFTAAIAKVLPLLQQLPNATLYQPAPGVSAADFVKSLTIDISMSASHWVGSTKMGPGGAGGEGWVVDTETRVRGVRGLHVVDAGIVNGVPTSNPQSVFVVVAQRAAVEILKLG